MPVLLCTTKYYSSTTPVLLSTTPVLQRTTPLLLCTTKYYASTSLYYKVLLRYYSVLQSITPVLQSTTPVLLCTTKYYANTTLYYVSTTTYYSGTTLKGHLQCAAQQESPSNFTKYRACHTKWMSSMICVTYESSFPMRVASKNQPGTSPNTAPATQNECHQWSASHMKRHFQCVEQVKSPSNLTKYCTCHSKWMSSMICVTYETSFPMRGASKVTLQPHQILRLPRKMNVINDLRHIWNVISNARSKQSHHPTSPNTAPATKFRGQHFNGESLNCFRQKKDDSRIIRGYPKIIRG